MKRLVTILAVIGLVAVAAPGSEANADRLTDKQIRTLLDDIRVETAAFERAIDPQVRKSILRSPRGEVDVEAFFEDLNDNLDKAQKRLGRGYSASSEMGTFLSQASRFETRTEEGRSLFGAETTWKSLRPLLVRLSNAYNIDWESDWSTWEPRRKSDGEIQEFIDIVVYSCGTLNSSLQKELKLDKELSRTDRKAILARVSDLELKAGGLSKDFKRTQEVETGLTRMDVSIEQFEAAMEGRSMSSGTAQAWDRINDSLDDVRDEFGL